jgi:hypothetical protein
MHLLIMEPNCSVEASAAGVRSGVGFAGPRHVDDRVLGGPDGPISLAWAANQAGARAWSTFSAWLMDIGEIG